MPPSSTKDDHDQIHEALEQIGAVKYVVDVLNKILDNKGLPCNRALYFKGGLHTDARWKAVAKEVNKKLKKHTPIRLTGELCRRLNNLQLKRERSKRDYYSSRGQPQPALVSPSSTPQKRVPVPLPVAWLTPSPPPPVRRSTCTTPVTDDGTSFSTPGGTISRATEMEYQILEQKAASCKRKKEMREGTRADNLKLAIPMMQHHFLMLQKQEENEDDLCAQAEKTIRSLYRDMGEMALSDSEDEDASLVGPEAFSEEPPAAATEDGTLVDPASAVPPFFDDKSKLEASLNVNFKYVKFPFEKKKPTVPTLAEFVDVAGDGHCFFHCSSQSGLFRYHNAVTGTDVLYGHLELRNGLADFILNNATREEAANVLRLFSVEIELEDMETVFPLSYQDTINRLTNEGTGQAIYATTKHLALLSYLSKVPIFMVIDELTGFEVYNFQEMTDRYVGIGKAKGIAFPAYDANPWQKDCLVVYHHAAGNPTDPCAEKDHFGLLVPVKPENIDFVSKQPIYLGGKAWENTPF